MYVLHNEKQKNGTLLNTQRPCRWLHVKLQIYIRYYCTYYLFLCPFLYLEPIPFNELLILTTQDPHVLSTKLHPVEFLGVKFLAGGFLYPVHVQWSQRGWPLATSWSATTQRKSPTGGALNNALRWFLRDQRWCREGGIWLVKGGWGEDG